MDWSHRTCVVRIMAIETRKIPLGPANRNVDPTLLSDECEFLMNCYRDEKGGYNVRPGRTPVEGVNALPLSFQGLYWWDGVLLNDFPLTEKRGCLAGVVGGVPYLFYSFGFGTVTAEDIADATIAGPTTPRLNAHDRVSFASNGRYLFMANGGRIVYIDSETLLTTQTQFIADGDAPSFAEDLALLDGYLLAFDRNTNQWYFSDLNDPFTWNALDFASAAGNPDIIQALRVWNREIYLFGSSTIERWENSAETGDFQRIAGGFIEVGCSAPKSPVVTDTGIYFLDTFKHFQVISSGSLERISTPYDREVADMSVVDDCYGTRMEINGRTFLVFTFPTENRTLAMDLLTKGWCEFGRWNSALSRYDRWDMDAYGFSPAWNLHFIGARESEGLLALTSALFVTNDGALIDENSYILSADNPIRPAIRSGHISYGTTKMKRNAEIRICARTGDGISSGTPQLMLRWRDNGRDWSNEFYLSLGEIGERNMVLRKQRCGMYRTRQYESACADAVPFVVGDCEEDLEFLR
jgi:hypothetical protein